MVRPLRSDAEGDGPPTQQGRHQLLWAERMLASRHEAA